MGFVLCLCCLCLLFDMCCLLVVVVFVVLVGGVVQVNLLVGCQVGLFFDGVIVWLINVDWLYQLLLGVVGIVIGIVLLFDILCWLKVEDIVGGCYVYNCVIEFVLFLIVFVVVVLMVVSYLLILVLFQCGVFFKVDVGLIVLVLVIYGVGLLVFVL